MAPDNYTTLLVVEPTTATARILAHQNFFKLQFLEKEASPLENVFWFIHSEDILVNYAFLKVI